ncbi:hypothetical protein [Streptomyces sp. NPDC060194]|uniref:hypothetical protein n=1 Tax=Streptomyces sp. NPDC060194 TaxID=3347069 RepID=UPI00365583FB
MTVQDIRIRLDGTAGESDIGALHAWLEQESPLDELVRAGELHIHERQRRDQPGAPMGLSQEIVLVVAASVSTVTAEALLQQVRQSVEAWRANRRQVENGEPPEGRVERDEPDGTDGTGGRGDADAPAGQDGADAPAGRDGEVRTGAERNDPEGR